jgi:hypothetical protein
MAHPTRRCLETAYSAAAISADSDCSDQWGGSKVSIPVLQLENYNGRSYRELEGGESISNWLGVLRTVRPAETLEGQILFDVPLTSYRLRVPDGAGPGEEKYAWISIPLRLDVDAPPALPGGK